MLFVRKISFLLFSFICLTAFTCKPPPGSSGNGTTPHLGGDQPSADNPPTSQPTQSKKLSHSDTLRIKADNSKQVDSVFAIEDTANANIIADMRRAVQKSNIDLDIAHEKMDPDSSMYKRRKPQIDSSYYGEALVFMSQELDSVNAKKQKIDKRFKEARLVTSSIEGSIKPDRVEHIEDSLKADEFQLFHRLHGFKAMTSVEIKSIAINVSNKFSKILSKIVALLGNNSEEIKSLAIENNEVETEYTYFDFNLALQKFERKLFNGTYFGPGVYNLSLSQSKTISDTITGFVNSLIYYIGKMVIDSGIDTSKANPSICLKVFSDGYTDSKPYSAGNDTLSARRAHTVGTLANSVFSEKTKGKTPYNIHYIFTEPTMWGYGEKLPHFPKQMGLNVVFKGPDESDPNRRVVLLQCVFLPGFKCN